MKLFIKQLYCQILFFQNILSWNNLYIFIEDFKILFENYNFDRYKISNFYKIYDYFL